MNEITYKLERKKIIEIVPKHLIGNYWLGFKNSNDEFNIKYIGRSLKWINSGLQKRLLDHASKNEFTHFSYRAAGSTKEVYNIECREYHRLRDQIVNIRHPDSPHGLDLDCEYCRTYSINQNYSKSLRDGVLHG
jgi:hypothetical protein